MFKELSVCVVADAHAAALLLLSYFYKEGHLPQDFITGLIRLPSCFSDTQRMFLFFVSPVQIKNDHSDHNIEAWGSVFLVNSERIEHNTHNMKAWGRLLSSPNVVDFYADVCAVFALWRFGGAPSSSMLTTPCAELNSSANDIEFVRCLF